MSLLGLWVALALALFVLGCAAKALRLARMPVHVRWELYPVAHESKEKAAYGGSYFEELDWWTKPRERDRLGEIKVMASEVLALKGVRERNPGLWLPSLLFHYGLYLLFSLGAVLLLEGAAAALGLRPLPGSHGCPLFSAWGAAGLIAGTLGATRLLLRRTLDPQLRSASAPADFLHLGWLLLVFAASWGCWLFADRSYAAAARFLSGLGASTSPWFTAQLVLLGAFLAYLPASHMTHFFSKYFTWHSVRWDDRPALEDAARMKRVHGMLLRPIGWSAPHIGADGKKTWVDVATRREDPS